MVGLWESDVSNELADVSTSELVVWDDACSNDLDGITSSTVSTRHLHVHLGDSSAESSISVFFVHVNVVISGQISQENSIVSDGSGLLLEDLAS